MTAEQQLQQALSAYAFGKGVREAGRYGMGHINDTFCVTASGGERFILQRISSAAFSRPDHVMHNVAGVTDYLKAVITAQGGDPERETLSVVRTTLGKTYFTDSEGGAWRAYPFIEDTVCLQTAQTPELFEASGRAFGKFQRMLRDFPAHTLYETIPRFHDTPNRLEKFKKALQEDAMGRASGVKAEIDFVLAREKDCGVCLEALRANILPLRVTHNDTKLNNVLFDRNSGEAICVIDLDTVMPGLSINDFGDSIRFGANHCAEDETDLAKVQFDLLLFEAYTRGFLYGAGGALTTEEVRYLPWGAKLMTFECGMRFLTDYLEGDRYFAIHRPEQNLDRCRTQFTLVSQMERDWALMHQIVQKYGQSSRHD